MLLIRRDGYLPTRLDDTGNFAPERQLAEAQTA